MKIQYNILIGIILVVGLISAVVIADTTLPTTTSTIKLSVDDIKKLADKNITKLSVTEYPCSTGRCFKFNGDLNYTIATIPNQICDKYKTIVKRYSNNRIRNIRTDECIRYRNLTDNEVYKILDEKALKNIQDTIKTDNSAKSETKYGERTIL